MALVAQDGFLFRDFRTAAEPEHGEYQRQDSPQRWKTADQRIICAAEELICFLD
jgi:hypothetical protein